MDIKSQFKIVKEYWLISLIILVLVFIVSSINFNIPNTTLRNSISSMDSNEEMMMSGKQISSFTPQPWDDSSFNPEIEDRILTQTTYLSSEVRRGRFEETDEELKNIVNQTNSFLLNESVVKYDNDSRQYYSGSYSIRVETSKYNVVIADLKKLGEVREFNKSIDDITDGYTKLTIELGAEKDRLSRYEALYRESRDVEDKLALSDRIYNQERIIKYYEDRLNGFDEKVEYSNIQLQLNEKHSNYTGIKFVNFGTLINNLVSGINNLLVALFFLVPYGLLVLLGYYGFIWWKRKYKRNSK